jgi:predicted phage terminase large subunit-like protein
VRIKRIPTKAEGNEYFPLPPDYDTLTEDGQRQARVNACRQWLVPTKDPDDKALRFVSSVLFFDQWYLFPDEEDDFNPMFYDEEPVPIPDGHLGIYKEWANSRASITIAPRGFAKSNCIRKSILLQMLTRPGFSFIYATSTNDNAKQTGQIIKTQFTENARIHEDWMPEFPDNRITPRRGEASFGIELMYLKNGSWFRAISSESRQRGGRPRCYVLDDPEYDPRASTSMSVLRSYMDNLLFKVVMPMVTRPNTSIRWLATFVSRRHYAWYAMDTVEDKKGIRAKDPRFNHWNRMVIKAAYHDEQKNLISCWPEMWPVDKESKKTDPRLKERISLEEIREMIGSANFASEYMADPGSSDETFFPELDESMAWNFTDVDHYLGEHPHASMTMMNWKNIQGEPVKKPLAVFLEESWVFMTVDTSWTATRDSDFKVCTVMAATPDNELFVLDLWGGQCDENTLIKNIFRMADKWKVPSIRPEVVKQSISLYQNLDSIVKQRATEMVKVDHLPKVAPLRVGMVSKESRIAALQFRFENGLIKFPLERRMDPHWKNLFDQIEQFNPEVKDGGLAKDDHIDTVSMSGSVLKGRIARREEDQVDDRSPEEHIMDGDFSDEFGVPYAYRLNKIDPSLLNEIEDLEDERRDPPSRV